MTRGDLVTVVLEGDYGKPRPALVVQSGLFDELPSVTIMPITSELRDTPLFRLDVQPSVANGLKHRSQIMVDKIHTLGRDRIGQVIGVLENDRMISVDRHMALFLGLG